MGKIFGMRVRLFFVIAAAVIAPTFAWAISSAGERPDTASPSGTGSVGEPIRYSATTLRLGRDKLERTDPNEILNAVLSRYGGSAIVEASFGAPTSGWTCTEEPSIPCPKNLRDGLWLYFTVAAPASGAASMRSIWEANLVAGAVRDELHMAGSERELIAANVSVRLPSGKIQENVGGGMGNVAFEQSFDDARSASVAARVRESATELGLDVRSVAVLRPLQAAPAVVVAADDLEQFVAGAAAVVEKILGGKATYEGVYLEADDRSGQPAFVQASAFRTGVGMRWVRPELAGQSPYMPSE